MQFMRRTAASLKFYDLRFKQKYSTKVHGKGTLTTKEAGFGPLPLSSFTFMKIPFRKQNGGGFISSYGGGLPQGRSGRSRAAVAGC